MKIKAAVFDIDGTLVPYGAPGPGQAAVQALRELAQSGVAVVIATGRARYTAQWVLGSGIKPDYFAAVNGADVTDAAGRPVWQSRMTPEEMYALVDFCEDHELPLEFIFSDAYYVYVEKYCGQNAASGFFDSVLRDGEDQVRHLQDMPFGACAAMDARHAAAFEAKYGHLGLRFIPFAPGRYDVLRADRSISVNSLEARVPFGDLDFVRYVMSIDPAKKLNTYGKGKYLLRKAFEGDWLPEGILWREKAAFSDAVGHSMVDDLKEYAETVYTDRDFAEKCGKYTYARPFTKESLLYREIFEKYYPGQAEMIVDYWMPNKAWPHCDVNDPSARVLANYGASGQ